VSGWDAVRTAEAVLSGGVVGFFIGMTGIGGGVLVMPALVAALGTSFLVNFAVRVPAAVRHTRLGNTRWDLSGWTILGVTPGIALSAWTVMRHKAAHGAATHEAVRVLAAAVIAISFALLLWNTLRQRQVLAAAPVGSAETPRRLALKAVGFGLLLGALMGATSIGGGVFMLPVLIATFGLSPREAVGTSNLIGLAASFLGLLAYQGGGEVLWPAALSMFAGALPGVWVGAGAASKARPLVLRVVMLALMVLAVAMLFVPTGGR
jgi:uncharacterized membrane protein YfcA